MELHFLKTTWSDIIILKNNDDIALIDTGFEEQFNDIKNYLDKLNINHISFILLTHFHRDHYGCISKIISNYKVDNVYYKEYSALDNTTATGIPADDSYRENELNKWFKIKKDIETFSNLVRVENVKEISFSNYKIELFHTSNAIKEVYNDKSNKETYKKILFSENRNCLAAFLKVNGVNILLAGDIFDTEKKHHLVSYVNYDIATTIKEEIDIYKVPHHGTTGCNSKKTLEIYKPKTAIITNSDAYLKKESTIYNDLRRANKDVKILLTENENIIISIDNLGNISCKTAIN
ncbi:MAG: MBL fold metallo-hydrolase [Ruminococcus sp.]|nr:MBL fold metallo-hydrolase [Ruminococcus sp.]